MILGPWDHSWGDGREVFAETYRTACELKVVADVLTPGAVADIEQYYPAFDVLLNTSSYEGLSISMLEARSLNCPIVAADVGGAAEIVSELIPLVAPDSTPEQFADSILQSVGQFAPPAEPAGGAELIPELWSLLGQFGDPKMYDPEQGRAACLVDTIATSSPHAKAIKRLLAKGRIQCVLVRGSVEPDIEHTIREGGAQIYDVEGSECPACSARAVLRTLQEIGISSLFIVDPDCKLRLLLAKILPPESFTLYDADSQDVLFQRLAEESVFQRRIAFDDSAYFRRLSPWPDA
jgi:hypothetical protein